MAVVKVTDVDFKARVLESPKPVIVDVSTTWCPSCRMLEPVFEDASERHGGVVFAAVNASENPHVSRQYGIEYVPTLLAFKNGECVKKFVGAMEASQLDEFISDI